MAIQSNRESAVLWLLANLANAEDIMRSRSRNSSLCKGHGELKVVMDILVVFSSSHPSLDHCGTLLPPTPTGLSPLCSTLVEGVAGIRVTSMY